MKVIITLCCSDISNCSALCMTWTIASCSSAANGEDCGTLWLYPRVAVLTLHPVFNLKKIYISEMYRFKPIYSLQRVHLDVYVRLSRVYRGRMSFCKKIDGNNLLGKKRWSVKFRSSNTNLKNQFVLLFKNYMYASNYDTILIFEAIIQSLPTKKW